MNGFTSKRLKFRDILESDFDNLFALYGDSEMMKFITEGKTLSEPQCRGKLDLLLREKKEMSPLGIWAAEGLIDGEFIGWFLLKKFDGIHEPGLGYSVLKKFRGLGFAREGAKAAIQYAVLKTNIDKLSAITTQTHSKSIAVLLDTGFMFAEKIVYKNPISRDLDTLNLYYRNIERNPSNNL